MSLCANRSIFKVYQKAHSTLARRLLIATCAPEMSLACAQQKTMESPFTHSDVYGVEHPTFGKPSSRAIRRKLRISTSHKGTSSSVKSRRSTSLVTAGNTATGRKTGHKKKKKKKIIESKSVMNVSVETKPPTLPTTSGVGSNIQTQFHSMRPPTVTTGLARVDTDSPVQCHPHASTLRVDSRNKHSNHIETPSDTTSGYSSSRSHSLTHSNSRTSISSSNFSVISRSSSTISTSDVLLSLNRSQDNLKSKIINSPINVSLKKAPQDSTTPISYPSSRRAFGSSPALKSAGLKGKGKKGERLTLEDVAWGLGRLQYRHVIVMTGAGISTPSGIPDFRSPGTGLYDNLQQYKIPDPTAIFDIGYFSRNPKPFFTLAKELYPGNYEPNHVHHFVRLLQEKGVLLRNYTQNIDGLERIAGISPNKLVEAHGSFSTASCIKCKSKQDSDEVKVAIFNGKVPRCKHKYCFGLVKPDIVFFGEDLPARFHSLQLRDFSKCDLLIIMGTSLEVEPFASLSTLPSFNVPRLLINRELVGPFKHHRKRVTDVAVTGDLVESVCAVMEGVGWTDDLDKLMGVVSDEEDDREIVPRSDSIDIQTVASEDAFSTISDQSEPALLSPVSITQTESITSTPSNDQCSNLSDLTSQMADLKLIPKEERPEKTVIGLLESIPECESGVEIQWRLSMENSNKECNKDSTKDSKD